MFVRQDIPLQHQIVQSNHASISLASWMEIDGIPNLVLIGVRDIAALLRVQSKLESADIDYLAWTEPDYDLGFTALATEPLDQDRKSVLKNYKLWQPIAFPCSSMAELTADHKSAVGRLFESVQGNQTSMSASSLGA